jgi:hypothetical protein
MRQLAGAFHFHLPVVGWLATRLHLPMVGTADITTTAGMLHSTAACTQPDMVDTPLMVPSVANPRVCLATTAVQRDANQAAVVQLVVLPAVAA